MSNNPKPTIPSKEQVASVKRSIQKAAESRSLLDNFPNHDIVDVKRSDYPIPETNATVVLGGGLLYQVAKATKKGGVVLTPMLKKLVERKD